MHTITFISPTALLKRTHIPGALAQVQCIAHFTDIFSLNHVGDIAVIQHTEQSTYQLEQLLGVITQTSATTKIVVVTSHYSNKLAICCYKKGADFCISDRIGAAVLPYLLTKLLSVTKLMQPNIIAYKNISLNKTSGRLEIFATAVLLRRRETQIMSCLLSHKNQTVTRNMIIDYVWRQDFVPAETTLDVYIRRLRIKLGKYNKLLETVRGFGYKANLQALQA